MHQLARLDSNQRERERERERPDERTSRATCQSPASCRTRRSPTLREISGKFRHRANETDTWHSPRRRTAPSGSTVVLSCTPPSCSEYLRRSRSSWPTSEQAQNVVSCPNEDEETAIDLTIETKDDRDYRKNGGEKCKTMTPSPVVSQKEHRVNKNEQNALKRTNRSVALELATGRPINDLFVS